MSKVNSNRNKISRNTIWYLVAGLGGHAYLLISLPLIQGALLPSEFGSFMILSQVTIILQMAISGLFSGAIIRLRVEYSEIEQRYFIFTVILSAVALQAAIWAILAWLGEPLLIAFYPNLTPNLGVLPTLLGAWNLILTVRTLVTTFLKSQEAPKRLLTLNLCYGITLLASLWVTLIAQPLEIGEPNALVRVFWAIIFAELTASFMASYFLSGHLVPKLKGNYIRVILKFTTPLALGSIMLALVFNLDIIILARYISLETLGIYAFGATLGKASAAVVTAYVSAYSPHLINRLSLRSIAETSKMIEKIMADNLVFLGVITGVVILCAEAIIAIMLSPPSQTEINVMSSPGLAVWSLVAICIGNLSRSVFLVFYNTIFMLKRTWLLL
ncbi:MAG: lipopolysaccharide biosynthesis protein, partial [Pseudomonadales bacterium]